MRKIIENIFSIRNLIMIIMTIVIGILLIKDAEINKELLMLFCTSYGVILHYFFGNSKGGDNNE